LMFFTWFHNGFSIFNSPRKMLSKVAVFALMAAYAAAECNNMCSGHGVCGANDGCVCYRNWRAADCSERTCQYGVSFVDTAQGDLDHDGIIDSPATSVVTQWAPSNTLGTFEQYFNFAAQEAHAYMECSNKGLCDRATGECVCFDGYEGSACQRTVCPNACSGHGVCRNMQDVTRGLAGNAATDYQLWDGLKNQACVCDPGYQGVDCHERRCPRGADPLVDTDVYEIQAVDIGTTAGAIGGTFQLKYTDVFGEDWTTSAIATANNGGADNVKNALKAIPNSVIQDVTVTVAATAKGGQGSTYSITFTNNAGNLPALRCDVTSATGTNIACTIAQTTAGTAVDKECSGRGLCDYETGLCKCFRGYRLADCSSQHALAYGSTLSV
jgi:hypothetical protein